MEINFCGWLCRHLNKCLFSRGDLSSDGWRNYPYKSFNPFWVVARSSLQIPRSFKKSILTYPKKIVYSVAEAHYFLWSVLPNIIITRETLATRNVSSYYVYGMTSGQNVTESISLWRFYGAWKTCDKNKFMSQKMSQSLSNSIMCNLCAW